MIRFTLLCLLIAAEVPAIRAQTASEMKVRSVTFEGNTAFDDARLQGLMLMEPPGWFSSTTFSPRVFEDDVKNIENFYHSNGYLDVVVEPLVRRDTARKEVDIHLRLQDGSITRVDGISIFGNEVFPDSVLLQFVNLAKGEPFRRNRIQEGMLAMVSLYADSGYLDASVVPDVRLNTLAHTAIVDFIINEREQCTIEEIRIVGLENTDTAVVRRELLFSPGEVVRYSRLLQSQRNLYLSGLFSGVFIRPETADGTDSSKKIILVELKEKLLSEFNVILGYGSVEKVKGRVELSTQNLAGTARKAGVTLSADFIKQGAEVSFTEPWTFGTRWRTDAMLYFELQQEPGYDLRKAGGRFAVGRSLGTNSNISITYRHEDVTLTDVKTTDLPANLDPRVRSVKLSFTNDTRNDPFDTRSGTYMEWGNEIAGAFLKGTNTFVRSVLRTRYFSRLSNETVLGSAFEIGWMDYFGSSREIPLNERFYAGGPNSIRSFDYQKVGPLDENGNPRGGQFQIIWNVVELRQSIYKFIGGVLFADAGGVWQRINSFRLNDIRFAIGAGLRVNTPIGIIRLDYGFNPDKRGGEPRGNLYFSLGQTF